MSKEMKTVERDLSWMHFNHRILEEAKREQVPVLERINYLGFYSNNLDEFYRVRVAGLRRVAATPGRKAKGEAERAAELLKQINRLNAKYAREYTEAVAAATRALEPEHIHVVNELGLNDEQHSFVRRYCRERLAGRLSPVRLDEIKHFNTESDSTIYFIFKLTHGEHKPLYAILPLPHADRWVELPPIGQEHYIIYLDDVLRASPDMIFPGLEFDRAEAYSFKFTRDAEMEIDNDLTRGFMQKVAKGVSSRRSGAPLRLVYDQQMPEGLLRRITKRLNRTGDAVTAIPSGRYQNHRDLMHFPDLGRADLRFPRREPIDSLALEPGESVIELIRRHDIALHVPYQSFDGYIRLLAEAAICPRVVSIKTTLYRLARDSKVVNALINAAENGKKVTAVIELLARFDEESNIDWSKRMQQAGVEVVFGVEKLKVHSKITHIAFSSGPAIACVSTGNFHEGNAQAYTDLILMTAKRNITADVARCFDFIERPFAPTHFRELLVSPNDMRRRFTALIDTEIKNHLAGRPAYIRAKLNHVTDPALVGKIYEAAEAGVPVDMLVRGNCSLTDNPGLGSRLRVQGIIDRYLEHSRIFIFANNGDERVYIGSADWMPRNLDLRIEVITPVYDPAIKDECRRIVDYGLADNVQSHTIVGPAHSDDETPFRSQEALYRHYLNTDNNGKD